MIENQKIWKIKDKQTSNRIQPTKIYVLEGKILILSMIIFYFRNRYTTAFRQCDQYKLLCKLWC